MQGFFEEYANCKKPLRQPTCASCGLYRKVLSPKMKPFGKFKKRILNIGEAPGETEDRRGKQWQGKAGRILRRTYRKLGIDLFRDCLNINAVNCRPTTNRGTNRKPTTKEINACRKRVLEVIEKYKPNVIILLGNAAIESIIGNNWKKDLGGINKWRGFTIPDRSYGAWICPVYHPSFIMRNEDRKEAWAIWERDLKRAFSMVEKQFPNWHDEKNMVEIVDLEKDKNVLKDLPRLVAIDYETTGLKPQHPDQKIICGSLAMHDVAYAFMLNTPGAVKRFRKVLRDKKIGKIAHNMKFEQQWSIHKLNTPVVNWRWDTMLASHIYDNRDKITGLKFQTYVNFGVADYDSDVSPYLKSNSKSGNAKNKVEDMIKNPTLKKKLLTYCGMDSLFTFRLAMNQMARLAECSQHKQEIKRTADYILSTTKGGKRK